MKTRLITNFADCALDSFKFAGFAFPKYAWTMERGNLQQRLADRKSMCTGPYYHAPKPVCGSHAGRGFYLDSDGQPFSRWQYCDEVDGSSVRHTGWVVNEYGETIRGIVAILPHGRYLAGWTMGEHMASEVDGTVYLGITEAARAADSLAEAAANRQRECEEAEQARQENEERDDEASIEEEEHRIA